MRHALLVIRNSYLSLQADQHVDLLDIDKDQQAVAVRLGFDSDFDQAAERLPAPGTTELFPCCKASEDLMTTCLCIEKAARQTETIDRHFCTQQASTMLGEWCVAELFAWIHTVEEPDTMDFVKSNTGERILIQSQLLDGNRCFET